MAFSFGFSEDIGSDDDSPVVPVPATVHSVPSPVATSQVPVRSHTLDDLVGKTRKEKKKKKNQTAKNKTSSAPFEASNKPTINQLTRKNKQLATLPEHLSYSTVRIESPLGKIVYLPRRELFDVRAQLLQENSSASDQVVENLDKSDLRSGIYEGGFKTWECSIDLASFLLDRGPRKDIDELVKCDQILEVSDFDIIPFTPRK